MNKPFVFDLHEDEWQLWRDLGFTTWSWGSDLPPLIMRPGLPPVQSNRRQVIIPAESAEQFRMWQILRDWHADYFDQLWHTYQDEHIWPQTPPPVAESGVCGLDFLQVSIQLVEDQNDCGSHNDGGKLG